MLTLNDGRKELYQWDTGRTATVDIGCDVVHFSNLKYGSSLAVEVKNGEVAIPNKLLTSGEPIYCWAFVADENGNYTKQEQTLNVNKRAKPSDYVYTETETLTWKSLDERITELEKGGTGDSDAVKYTVQELTDDQKAQARTNIGAVSADEVPEQAQADMAQNDSTASDFVKNRTHWFEESEYLGGTYPQDSEDTEIYFVEGYSYYLKALASDGRYFSYQPEIFNSNFSQLGSSGLVTLILLEDYKGTGTYKCRITLYKSFYKKIEVWRADRYFELNNNYIPKPSDDGTLAGGVKAFIIKPDDDIKDFEYIYHSNNGIAYTRSDIVYRDSFYLKRTDFISKSELNSGLAEIFKKIICNASGESSAYFPDLNNSSYPIEITTLKNRKFLLDTADGKRYISTFVLNGDEVEVVSSQETTSFISLKEDETLLKSGFKSGTSTYDSIGIVEGKSYSFEIYSVLTGDTVNYLELTAVYSESLGMAVCFSDGNSTNANNNRFWVGDTKSYIMSSWVSNAGQSLKAVYGKQIVPSIPKEAVIGLNDSAGILTVTAETDPDGNVFASHSASEIYEAFQSGKAVQLLYGRFIYQLSRLSDNYTLFSFIGTDEGTTFTDSIVINNNKNIISMTDGNLYKLYPVDYVLNSSTEGSTKRFRITVDDGGTLSATEVTE